MGFIPLSELRFIPPTFVLCAFLLSFPTPTFTQNAPLQYALPRLLLHNGHHNPDTLHARPSCETNCTIHHEEEHALAMGLTIKAIKPSSSCKQTYGVMPCTHSIIGGIFLLFAYGYIIYRAARLLVTGSELLLVVLGPSIVGGLVLPIFGVLPDSILVLVSGMGSSKDEAQEEILIGIGVLAGSNVMLLTLLWGTCLILGRCDLEQDPNGNLTATNKKLSKKFDLFGTGVEVDKTTQVSAGIMCASIIPFIIAQLPYTFHVSATKNIAVLIACLISFGGLLTYIIYQVMVPKLKERKKFKAFHNLIFHKLLKYTSGENKLVYADGQVNEVVLKQIFDHLDLDNDQTLTRDEIRVMLTVSYYNKTLYEDVVEHFMKEFDTNASNTISWEEFLDGMKRWCKDIKPTHIYSFEGQEFLKEEYGVMIQENIEADERKGQKAITRSALIRKAIFLLLVGTFLIGLFAEPLVDAVTLFSQASRIPPFFVSFVLLPIASNSSEAISSIIFSSRKQKVNMCLTYSQIYGGVTMNNTMSLGILLAIIYARHLVWEFSSEVLVICLVTLVMGVIALIRRILPLWMAGLVLLMYPASIALVAILDYVIGWK